MLIRGVIGGVTVGIQAVIGVFAMEEDRKPRSSECDEDGLDELEEDTEEEGKAVVRIS